MRFKMILPCVMNKDTRLSFHLCTILNQNTYPWFYERFINIKAYGSKSLRIELTDNMVDESYRPLFEERICYNSIQIGDNLIDILKERITLGFYAYLWVDKYAIPDTDEYHKYSFLHPVMVYGFDDNSELFYLINFTGSKGSYIQKIPYNSVLEAYSALLENGKKYSDGLITVLTCHKPNKSTIPKQFSLTLFLIQLSNYIYSRPDNLGEHDTANVYGLATYKKIVDVCKHIDEGYSIIFKSFYDLGIQKHYIHERLKYIRDNYQLSEELSKLVDKYKRVSDIFNIALMLNIKYQMALGYNISSFCTDKRFIERLLTMVTEAEQIENETLVRIYTGLLDTPERKNISCSPVEAKIIYAYDEDLSVIDAKVDSSEYIRQVIITDSSPLPVLRPMGILTVNGENKIRVEDSLGIGNKNRNVVISPQIITDLRFEELLESSGNIKELHFSFIGLSHRKMWDFSKSDYLYWNPDNDIDNFIFGDDGVTYIINGNDAHMSCYDINVHADEVKYIYLKCNNMTNSEVAQLFFTTYDDNDLDEAKSKIITLGHDNYQCYTFNMTDNPHWKGVIKDLRFDLTGYDNTTKDGKYIIKEIVMDNIRPVYNSSEQFSSCQGVNGWFYYMYDNGTSYREMIYNTEKSMWEYGNCPELCISDDMQNSLNHLATVRRWVCQGSGNYEVSIDITPIKRIYKGYLTVKQNHRIIKFYSLDFDKIFDKFMIELELGENLNFEFYNENEKTCDNIRVNVVIKNK